MSKSTDSQGSRAFLELVKARFEQQYLERQKRIEKKRCQREVELVHSQYLKQNVVNSSEMAHAKFVVGTWSHKHGDAEKKWLVKDKREKQRMEARFSPYGKSPNSSRRQNSSPREQQHENFSSRSLPKSGLIKRTSVGGTPRSMPVSTAASTSTSSSPTVISLDDTPDEVVSLDDTPDEVVTDNTESTQHSAPLACPVLYCEVLFTTRDKLEKHMRDFDHCPINPCMVNLDGVLAQSTHRSYICTSSDESFGRKKDWGSHQHGRDCKSALGDSSSTPRLLVVAGYLCPRTLSIFSSYDQCETSINKGTEDILKFPFQDDSGVTPQSVKPCPVSKAFVDDFTARCKSCAYSVSCIDCGVELVDSGSVQDHILLFDQTHVLTSRSTVSKEDVFTEYITEHISNFTKLLAKYITGYSGSKEQTLKTFSNFVCVLCHVLEENM